MEMGIEVEVEVVMKIRRYRINSGTCTQDGSSDQSEMAMKLRKALRAEWKEQWNW